MAAPLIEVDESRYEAQLAGKVARVRTQFRALGLPEELDVFRSAKAHYRMRAEFRVWHEGDRCYYIMFKGGGRGAERVRVDNFTVGSKLMNEAMAAVLEEVHARAVLKAKLYQVNYHTALSGQCMVTMVYHKVLKGEWEAAAEALRGKLAKAPGVQPDHRPIVIGRSRGKKTSLDRDFVVERLAVAGRELQYKQVEANFSQPNAGMCQQMLAWAHEVTRGSPGDLLELYGGNGNFCIALAPNFAKGVMTELSKTSIKAAKYNLEANGVENIKVAQATAEDFSAAWLGKQPLKNLQKERIDLGEYDFRTILVDPPRAGLDDATVKLAQELDRIVYISW